ncbi:hypothetical protein D3C76_735400 [compost metagenome]
MPCFSISAQVRSTLHNSSSRGITAEPNTSGVSQRSWAPSKLIEANCSSRSSGVMPYSSPIDRQCMANGPWATLTPFGRPVEPEV